MTFLADVLFEVRVNVRQIMKIFSLNSGREGDKTKVGGGDI